MMAMSEAPAQARPMSLTSAALRIVLSIVLAHAALIALSHLIIVVTVLDKADLLWGPPHWASTGNLAKFLLLFLAACGAVLWLRPWRGLTALSDPPADEDSAAQHLGVASFLLASLTLMGVASVLAIVVAVNFNPRNQFPVNPMTWAFVALDLIIAAGGFWALRRLQPWVRRQPLSPSTRRTNALFGLSGLICVPGTLALAITSMSADNPFGLFSNGPIALWVALLAILSWLLAMVVGWWWYLSADEHERGAYDYGSVVGAGVFTALAPVWWVAARAGLVPQPDAMVLWLVTMIALSIGWYWRRSR